MRMENKGQSALEYLMTYGWALVVIVVVVAVLYALGVFNIGGSLETCSGFPAGQFTYGSHVYKTTGAFQLQFTNGPKDISVSSLTVDAAGTLTGAPVETTAGTSKTLSLTGAATGTAGTAYNSDVVMTYDVTGGLTGLKANLKCTGKFQ